MNFIFPVIRHSYINPDRVFDNIERELKKQTCIIKPEEVLNIIKKYGEVLYIPEAVTIYDYKSIVHTHMKKIIPFGIKSCKRLALEKSGRRVLVRSEVHHSLGTVWVGSTLL